MPKQTASGWFHQVTIRTRLLTVVMVCSFTVFLLIALSNSVMNSATESLGRILSDDVRPLATANRLQGQLNHIRTLEIELAHLEDFFAVSNTISEVDQEMARFGRMLNTLPQMLGQSDEQLAILIGASWDSYKTDLREILANAMNRRMDLVEHTSTYRSITHFRDLANLLRKMARENENQAAEAYTSAVSGLRDKWRLVLITSAFGLLTLGLLIYRIFDSMMRRLECLRAAASAIADGDSTREIDITGKDELADLAQVFRGMRDRIQERKTALHEARRDLETRVEKRTTELAASNWRLRQEIAERGRAESALKLLSLAVEQSPVSVVITNYSGIVEYCNATYTRTTGYSPDEIKGLQAPIFQRDRTPAELTRQIWDTLAEGGDWESELLSQKKNGALYWERLHITPVKDAGDSVEHFLLLSEDISDRKEQEERIYYQAKYDSLTGLPNRTLALERLNQAIETARQKLTKVALMFIDLDDFKKINDTLGHELGDRLLVIAAQRLQQTIRSSDLVARYGGDEFLIIMGGIHEAEEARLVGESILRNFAPAFQIDNHEFVVTPSIGVAIFPDDGADQHSLLRYADIAMFDAKEAGRNTMHSFNALIHKGSWERLQMERMLRQAIARNELALHYQPLVDIHTRKLIGAEALIRWTNPAYGEVSPDKFIATAEQTGLIVELGEWVLRNATAQLNRWLSLTDHHFHMAVNVSPRQFRDAHMVDTLKHISAHYCLPEGALQLEVTEGLLMRNQPEVHTALSAITDLGITLAMDDFGTGYSSMKHLKDFPFSTLKIDRSFVRDMVSDPNDRALVSAAIRMGKGLGLQIVAEGVEDLQQLRILSDLGCDIVQGFLLGPPIDASTFEAEWFGTGSSAESLTSA